MRDDKDDLDLETPHLRPGSHLGPRAEVLPEPAEGPEPVAWEGRRDRGPLLALGRTLWAFASTPRAAFAATPAGGGLRRPWSFALAVGAILGTLSELIDALMVALLQVTGFGTEAPELLQLSIGGRSLEWLPVSVLSLGGCVIGLLIGVPLFLLAYSAVLLIWSSILHACLLLTGALRGSETGFEGTVRAVLYSQTALLAAPVPLVGDLSALIWSGALQVEGCSRMHGCERLRTAAAILLPVVLSLAPLVWLVWVR